MDGDDGQYKLAQILMSFHLFWMKNKLIANTDTVATNQTHGLDYKAMAHTESRDWFIVRKY